MAHEFGHQARNHLLKGIAWYALFALPARLPDRARRPGGGAGIGEPEAMPLALLVARRC